MEILENIEKTGSINQAAKMMKMSYKAAWSKIKFTEKHFNARIVLTDRKDGTRLTGEGKELLAKYRLLKKKCMTVDDKIFKSIFDEFVKSRNSSAFSKNGAHRKNAPVRSSGPTPVK